MYHAEARACFSILRRKRTYVVYILSGAGKPGSIFDLIPIAASISLKSFGMLALCCIQSRRVYAHTLYPMIFQAIDGARRWNSMRFRPARTRLDTSKPPVRGSVVGSTLKSRRGPALQR
jgi:hypothetical protein